jgi:tRNA (cytosine38-C5)-methyltransferase
MIQREKMVSDVPLIHTHIEQLGVLETNSIALDDIRPISDFLEDTLDESIREQVSIPSNLLKRSASWCFDIIQPSDRRSSCFTHSYGKFARGTGSVLYIGSLDPNLEEEARKRQRTDPEDESGTSNRTLLDCIQLVSPGERKFDGNWSALLQSDSDIRYLTGTEMARLMGFPIDNKRKVQEEEDQDAQTFRFPPTVTMKQQWKLIGNSLNVTVTAAVVELGLSYYLHLHLNLTKNKKDA